MLMVFLRNALMCIKKRKVKLINHDCLLILLLLYIMLYIMLACLMLFVCIVLIFLQLTFANAFFFMICFGLLTHIFFISNIILQYAVLLICCFS